jgi:hypothetical protein
MKKDLTREEIAYMSSNTTKSSNLLKDATNIVGLGIISQESGEFQQAKSFMKEGIEKIKEILIKENSQNNKLVLEYVSEFT